MSLFEKKEYMHIFGLLRIAEHMQLYLYNFYNKLICLQAIPPKLSIHFLMGCLNNNLYSNHCMPILDSHIKCPYWILDLTPYRVLYFLLANELNLWTTTMYCLIIPFLILNCQTKEIYLGRQTS